MKTLARDWRVLGAAVAVLGLALFAASRVLSRPGPAAEFHCGLPVPPQPTVDDRPTPLAWPAPELRTGAGRDRIERPLDEARCGVSGSETTFVAEILDARGRRVRNAFLASFPLDEGRPRVAQVDSARALDDGRACLRTSAGGEVLVAVFAQGFLPATRRVRAEIGARIDLEPFVLEDGHAIEGRVSIAGQPLGRAEVEITACAGCQSFEMGGSSFGWRGDRFVRTRVAAETAADGSYRAAGLDDGEHVVGLRTVRRRDVAVDVSSVPALRVPAPARTVDFAVPAARLELSFQEGGSPLCCVDVQIEAGDRQYTRTAGEDGRLVLLVQPALAYPLYATRRGYRTVRTQVRGLVDGERLAVAIALEAQRSMARVVVQDGSATRGGTATLQFRPRFPLMHGSAFERTVRRDDALGAFVVPDVPAGAWRITLQSGSVVRGASTTRLGEIATAHTTCSVDVLVDVPEEGTATVAVSQRFAPWASIVARDPGGRRLVERVKVFDANDQEVEGVLLHAASRPGLGDAGSEGHDAPTLVHATECGTSFRGVVFAEGYASEPFELMSGHSPPVLDMILKPR